MVILLSGGTGFIGSHLVSSLQKIDCQLILLVRNNKLNKLNQNIKYITEKDLPLLYQKTSKIDLIIHLATHFISKHSSNDIDNLIDANIKLGVKLLDLASSHNIKFINTSSYAQYISNENPHAQNLYAQTKKSFQEILKYYCLNEKVNAIDLELFDSYGPNDNRNKFYKLALKEFINNKTFKMSKGEQEICLIHVNDIIKAIMLCISTLPLLRGYNPYTLLNTKTTYILKELAFKIKEICGSNSKIETGFYDYRKNEIFKLNSRYDLLPDWKSSISLVEGISKILNKI